MKKNTLLVFLFISIFSFSQEKKCSDFKIGEFAYANMYPDTKIIRTEKKQIETNYKTGVKFYSSIEWTSDCEYILTYEEILNPQEDVSHMIGQKNYAEIVEINGSIYKVRAKNSLFDINIEFIKVK